MGTQGKTLFRAPEKDYGEEYKSHLISQYRLYIEGIEKVSDRRQNANNHFITINTILISVIGLSFQSKLFENMRWIRSVLSIIGIIVCIIFWFLIRAYKQLNSGKFTVVHEIEQKLPVALYDYEWHILKEGKDNKVYYPFSHVEMVIPWIFGIIYIVLGIAFLVAQ